MKNLFKKAHEMTRKFKEEYPEVDYRTQFGLCLSYLFEEEKEEEEVIKEARVNVVTDKWVSMKCFTEIETSRDTFVLPEIVEDEDMKIKREINYNVWEKYGKCRIYMNGEGIGGYIEVLKDGSINVVAKGQYMVERRMQEAIGMFAKNEKVEIVA